MKKLIVAFSLVLASGYVANTVYAAVNPTMKSEISKDGDKDKKKKGKSSCSTETKTATEGKSCCAGKKQLIDKSIKMTLITMW